MFACATGRADPSCQQSKKEGESSLEHFGAELRAVLEQQQQDVAVYNVHSYFRGSVTPAAALRIVATSEYVGIGSRKRIRAIRPLSGASTLAQLCQASRTMQRPRGMGGDLIAPGWVLEHRKQP